ncbi:MAG: GNAT family N-acetyltransferase [Betaproteobacteria bacterium RIFCSPLOWO2_12_FULL_62_58]|nr:MAG: GNAT family N-acetyltransferase [Betaproteobacteria bacterium RIFCSPLOWO2_12_FULL_62_58]
MLSIQPLRGNHDRSRFDSGSGELDLWLRQTAQQHQRRGISKTFVAVADDEPSRVLGFYALTACEVVSQDLPDDLAKRLPRKVPGIRLGRLAVDRTVQGQGLGELLLMDALDRARRVLEHVGVHALFVDAKDERAAAFYRKYGFRPLPEQPLQLVLVLAGLS